MPRRLRGLGVETLGCRTERGESFQIWTERERLGMNATKDTVPVASRPDVRSPTVLRFTNRVRCLYHLAEASNLLSIREHGLLSTERLLDLTGTSGPEKDLFLRTQRREGVRLSDGVRIRDQRPMPPSALAKALDDGLSPADWYTLLNSFVFMWADRERVERQRHACGDRPQYLLTFDSEALLTQFGAEAFVSPFNSGNARRKPARRGRDTLIPFGDWIEAGWPTGSRWRTPVEFLFSCTIPVHGPYLVHETKL